MGGLPEWRYRFNPVEKQPKRDCKPFFGAFDGYLMEQSAAFRALSCALDIGLGILEMYERIRY